MTEAPFLGMSVSDRTTTRSWPSTASGTPPSQPTLVMAAGAVECSALGTSARAMEARHKSATHKSTAIHPQQVICSPRSMHTRT